MKNRLIINIFIAYVVILLLVLIVQIPKEKEIIAYEPSSSELRNEDKLKNAVALYVDSPLALVNNKQIFIDEDNPDTVPLLEDSNVYIPVAFLTNAFGATTSWDALTRESTIRYNNKAIIFSAGNSKIKVIDNDSESFETIDSVPLNINGRLYLSLPAVSKAFEKDYFYDNGLIIISSIEGIFDKNKDKQVIDQLKLQLNNLPVVGSEENLKKILNINDSFFNEFPYSMYKEELSFDDYAFNSAPTADGAEIEAAAEDSLSDYSKTNVQVEGVDEADIVKTDGEYIYYVTNNNAICIAKAVPADSMELLSVISPNEKRIIDLYFHDDKLIALAANYRENKTLCLIYDIKDKKNTELLREVSISGRYFSSRKIENTIYLISTADVYSLCRDNKFYPSSYSDTANAKDDVTLDFADVHYFTDIVSNSYTNILSLSLDDMNNEPKIYSFLGSGNNIYVSEKNMYIATSKYAENSISSTRNTNIYKFALNSGNVAYSAHTSVEGTVLNQFSMDENDGYFRLTANIKKFISSTGKTDTSNSLYILDNNLNIVSSLTGIAPDERIYSTRFMGNRAYMVTFVETDPLFVIDLSDVKNPKILGELKIPGFSQYLHPYDDNHVIGIGRDTETETLTIHNLDSENQAVAEEITNVRTKGIKLSMFDISDVSNPKESFTAIIGDERAYSPVLSNHKALIFDKKRNIIAFPATDPNKSWLSSAYVYSIGNTEFLLSAVISHSSDSEENAEEKEYYYYNDNKKSVKRALLIGDNIYTLSDSLLMANNTSTFEEIGRISLITEEETEETTVYTPIIID